MAAVRQGSALVGEAGASSPGNRSPGRPRGRPSYRVLKIAPTSFFADYGCHVRIYEETRALARLGHRVTICTYPSGRDLPGLDIRRAPDVGAGRKVRVGSSLGKAYLDATLMVTAIRQARREPPHLVHAHLHEGALIGSVVARIFGVPLIFDFQGSLTSEMLDHGFLRPKSSALGPLRRLERAIDHQADVILTSSHHSARLLAESFDVPSSRIVPLVDSVAPDVFRPRWHPEVARVAAGLRRRLDIPEKRRVVVYLGLLADYQGTGKLLEAGSHLVQAGEDVHLLVMGFPGVERYRAQAQAIGLGDRTTFTGSIAYEEAPYYLAIGDVAVSPKISETEGNGKLLNYMAVGLPTVAFDTPVAREIMGELGVYARVDDARSLARGIAVLLGGGSAVEELSNKLRRRVEEEFSWETTGLQLGAIYDRLRAPAEADVPSMARSFVG